MDHRFDGSKTPGCSIGASQYVADLDLPAVLDVTYVTATVAHAVIRDIDVAAARAVPGVVDVVTAADLDLGCWSRSNPAYPEAMLRPLLATGAGPLCRRGGGGDRGGDRERRGRRRGPGGGRLRAASRGRRSRSGGLRDEVLLFPEAGTNLVLRQEGGATGRRAGDAEATSWCGAVLSISGWRPRPLEGRAGRVALGARTAV